MTLVNPTKLHAELEQAGIPIEGVSSDGRIDFLPAATDEQKTQAAAIVAAHDPVDYDALRWAEYPDIRAIVLALIAGGTELEAAKAAIQAIDAKYSKT
jgi:hypothetical protein